MDERQVKEIYQQLKAYFHSKPEIPNFEEQFSESIEELATLIEQYEEKRATLMESFKNELKGVIDDFHQKRLQSGVEQLQRNSHESEENWKEVEPRM
jgi:predicted nuclease with TOPRIM domain